MATAARLQTAERSLNTMARKVLDAVPFIEGWPKHSIASEMRRQRGTAPSIDVVHGCLEHLRDVGLVKLTGAGLYQRVQARAALTLAVPAAEPEEPKMTTTTAQKPPKASPTDRLAGVAQSLRRAATALNDAADEIEDVALEYESSIAAVNGDVEKLRQLQAILASLGLPAAARAAGG